MWWGHGYGWDGFGWVGMLAGGLMMLLFWGGVIALAFFALRSLSRSQGPSQRSDDDRQVRSGDGALQILRERYARGEITRAEYDQIRLDLGERESSGRS